MLARRNITSPRSALAARSSASPPANAAARSMRACAADASPAASASAAATRNTAMPPVGRRARGIDDRDRAVDRNERLGRPSFRLQYLRADAKGLGHRRVALRDLRLDVRPRRIEPRPGRADVATLHERIGHPGQRLYFLGTHLLRGELARARIEQRHRVRGPADAKQDDASIHVMQVVRRGRRASANAMSSSLFASASRRCPSRLSIAASMNRVFTCVKVPARPRRSWTARSSRTELSAPWTSPMKD
jgi:hypothetical protein